MTDSTDELLSLLKSQEVAPIVSEPGRVMKRPDWLFPFGTTELARKERVTEPLLPRHLRMVRFASFTPDEAGADAWMAAARDVYAQQQAAGEIAEEAEQEPASEATPSGALHMLDVRPPADETPERIERVRGVAFAPSLRRGN